MRIQVLRESVNNYHVILGAVISKLLPASNISTKRVESVRYFTSIVKKAARFCNGGNLAGNGPSACKKGSFPNGEATDGRFFYTAVISVAH